VLSRGGRIIMRVLAVPTALCAMSACLYLYAVIWVRWSRQGSWVDIWGGAAPNSPFFLVLGTVVLANSLLLLVVGVWCLANARNTR